MSRTRRDQARGRLGRPHPRIPHLYEKVPQSLGEALYPNLRSNQQLRDRERDQARDRKKEKP
jgi:hypothetical protein